MLKMKIEKSISLSGAIQIKIDGLAHLDISPELWRGTHTYIELQDGSNRPFNWVIEIYLTTGHTIKAEYNTREKWETVLRLLFGDES